MRIFTVDSFTDRPFTGNPAAVCLAEGPLPYTAWLQQLAAELNLPATAFVSGRQLRWFSATSELDLCGHGTLAAAHILWEDGTLDQSLTFETRAGNLTATREPTGEVALDFLADPPTPVEPSPALVAAVGVSPVAAARGRLDLLAEVGTAQTLRDLTPDLAAVATLDCRGLIVTAPGDEGSDFVSRFFAPNAGIPEDPVTGSAHCTLAPYWAERVGKSVLTGHQLSNRGGQVTVELRGETARLRGRAVTITQGELAL